MEKWAVSPRSLLPRGPRGPCRASRHGPRARRHWRAMAGPAHPLARTQNQRGTDDFGEQSGCGACRLGSKFGPGDRGGRRSPAARWPSVRTVEGRSAHLLHSADVVVGHGLVETRLGSRDLVRRGLARGSEGSTWDEENQHLVVSCLIPTAFN